MRRERGGIWSEFIRLGSSVAKLGLVYWIASLARSSFDFDVRRAIKERAGGCCEKCGSKVGIEKLRAGHINHNQYSPDYNSPENGMALCLVCEFRYHMDHFSKPEKIGLTREINDSVIYGLWLMLDYEIKEQMYHRYGEKMYRIFAQYNKSYSQRKRNGRRGWTRY